VNIMFATYRENAPVLSEQLVAHGMPTQHTL